MQSIAHPRRAAIPREGGNLPSICSHTDGTKYETHMGGNEPLFLSGPGKVHQGLKSSVRMAGVSCGVKNPLPGTKGPGLPLCPHAAAVSISALLRKL